MGEKRAYKARKSGGGRKKLKPEYDAGKNMKEQMDAAVALYNSEVSLQAIGEELGLNPIKVRKLLITAGVYESEVAEKVQDTFEEYRETQDYITSIGASKAGKGERGTLQPSPAEKRKEEGAGTDTMKNLKKPARLPRKAPSNQTGGTAWGKKMAAEFSRMMQSTDMKKLILLNFPYIIAFYMVEKAAWLYRHCNGDSVVDRLMVLFMNFGLAYKSVLPSFHPFDLMVGLVGAAALKAVIYFKGKNAKKYRQGEEYGSARWGNQKDIEPFIDPVFENNVILTQTERLMMSGRPKHTHRPTL